jgi:hypothetical protein
VGRTVYVTMWNYFRVTIESTFSDIVGCMYVFFTDLIPSVKEKCLSYNMYSDRAIMQTVYENFSLILQDCDIFNL